MFYLFFQGNNVIYGLIKSHSLRIKGLEFTLILWRKIQLSVNETTNFKMAQPTNAEQLSRFLSGTVLNYANCTGQKTRKLLSCHDLSKHLPFASWKIQSIYTSRLPTTLAA